MNTITRSLLIMLISGLSFNAYSQKEVHLNINHYLGELPFEFDKESSNDIGNAFILQRLEYYISEIALIHDGGQITEVDKYYILADASTEDTHVLGTFPIENLEGIRFFVGVDEIANHSDPTTYDADHPLSPKFPSMHWGWAAGYRFVALEGKTGANMLLDFQVHALGDQNYFETMIETTGEESDPGVLAINIDADYTKTISGIDISQGLIMHGSVGAAIDVMINFSEKVFTATEGQSTAINEIDVETFKIFPNPTRGTFFVENIASARLENTQIKVFNILGQSVPHNAEYYKDRAMVTIEDKGTYMVVLTAEGTSSNKIVHIN